MQNITKVLILISINLFCLVLNSSAQVHQVVPISLKSGADTFIKLPINTSSFAIEYKGNFDDIELKGENIIWQLKSDVHSNPNISAQIFLDTLSSYIYVKNKTQVAVKMLLHLLDANYQFTISSKKSSQKSCDKPSAISQDIWRAGLPESTHGRISQNVEHLIVHHSAGSTSSGDYTKIVRDIYLYHTEVNGWDDIGYNYVVAPNGDIYMGRDGEGYPEDEVRGAHFCGKNAGTMGICMLGDFTDSTPTVDAVASLKNLLAWKVEKELLNPMGTKLHPANSTAAIELPTIAGHRDGCATQCPGNSFYPLLSTVRDEVVDQLEDCGYIFNSVFTNNENIEPFYIRDNILTFNDISLVSKLKIYDLSGRELANYEGVKKGSQISLSEYPKQLIISMIYKDEVISKLLIKPN